MIGQDIKDGLLPNDTAFFGKMIQNICYSNAEKFFKF